MRVHAKTLGGAFTFCALLVASTASAAVAIDASTTKFSASANSLTWSHTVSGSNRYLLVGVTTSSNSPSTTGVTYAGQALSLLSTVTNTVQLRVYGLTAPPVGTANIVVTLSGSGSVSAGASSWTGVDQTTPTSHLVSASGSSDNPSLADNGTAGLLVVDVIGARGSAQNLNMNGGQSLVYNLPSDPATYPIMGSSSKAGAASVALGWGLGAGVAWAHVNLALAPVVSGAVGFRISYSNYGLYCLAQSVTITAVDGAGNPVTGYTGTVNLSTTTARGSWAKTAGNGTLTDSVPDDGAASYAWNGADTSATFALNYRAGAAVVTVNAVDSIAPSILDDGTQGAITFSPSGFTVTSSPFSNPAGGVPAFASPKTAGSNFSVYLTAYGQNPTDATCGIITGYAGAKNLKFWSTYVNPATGTIAPTVNGTAIAGVEGGASAQSVTFTSGQATVTANYKDTGSLSISMKDDTTGNPGLPTGIRGSTGSIVSVPANFVVTNIKRTSDNFANPAASSASGTVFITAGQSFTATVTAVESGGATTPNYGREAVPESAAFTATLVLPASGNTPAVAGTAGTFTNGVATGTAFSWPEVGIVRLAPHVADGSYLGAGDVAGSATGNVGRFVPNSFSTSLNTPVFGTACTAGSFTYVGQPFTFTVAPVITVTALAFGGATTQNYTGSFFRLTNASLTGRSYTPTPASPALDVSGLPATAGDPAIVDLGAGLGSLTFSAGSGIAFSRGTAVAPFNANIALSINVVDLDGVTAANPVAFGAGSGIAFSTSATQRYGRLALRNRVGSELLDLPLSLTTEYYVSSALGFTTNTADSCSVAPALAFSGYQASLGAGETCVRDTGNPGVSGVGCAVAASAGLRYRATGLAGDFNLNLAAPGSGNDGAVTVTATAPAWLKYLWNAGSGVNSNPSGMATFGLFPGPASRIYQREVY